MRVPLDLPQIALVRVESAGGPYRLGDRLSLGFVVPTVGRVVAHDGDGAVQTDFAIGEAVVPETVTVVVEHAAAPYERGERLTLAFVDPRVARIHPLLVRDRPARDVEEAANDRIWDTPAVHSPTEPVPLHRFARSQAAFASDRFEPPVAASTTDSLADIHDSTDSNATADVRSPAGTHADADVPDDTANMSVSAAGSTNADSVAKAQTHSAAAAFSRLPAGIVPDVQAAGRARGVIVRLAWTPERVRRFVQVVDKLFTVDRLGWYRHTLAMRLLIPDDVTCGDALGDIEAMRHVHALRAAAVETLGRPLLAAFMPNFSVSSEWLASLDSAHAARAVVGVRDALLPFVADEASPLAIEAGYTMRSVRRSDLSLGAASVEGSIAALVPTSSTNVALTECLEAYRATLVNVFGQTARATEAVRVNGMTQPNHSLDDRLWQLVGAVGEAFDGLAVA